MQQNRNKLSMQPSKQTGQDNSQTLIIIGVGLIVLALAVFGILFLFSKGSGGSSGGESSGGEQSLSANSADKSEADQNGNSSTPEGSAQVKVHFIDVGQGDCTLVMSHGEAMLIDSGEAGEKPGAGSDLVKRQRVPSGRCGDKYIHSQRTVRGT